MRGGSRYTLFVDDARHVDTAEGLAPTMANRVWIQACDGGRNLFMKYKLEDRKTAYKLCNQRWDKEVRRVRSDWRTYQSWKAMRQRCLNPNHDAFKWYGGRGITVCKRWSLFKNFLADMGKRPNGKTLDRKNPNGNYTLGNCRWSNSVAQRLNQRELK